MAYFLGRDVDVFVTLETNTADKAIGLSAQLDSKGYPLCAVVTSGSTTPSGTIFANTMNTSPGNVSGSRIHDLTGVDLSISASDEEVGPFLGHAATQSVELRKEQVVTLTHKKSDEVWDTIFNGPSDIKTFANTYTSTGNFSGVSGEYVLTGSEGDVAQIQPGDWIGGNDDIPLGAMVINIETSEKIKIDKALTGTIGGATIYVNSLPTFMRQGARAGIMYSGSTMLVADGRTPPWQTGSGTTYGNPTETSYYGYRVHIKMKNGGEIYTVKNAAITGHTVSMNADGTTEETIEFKSGVAPTMYTGSDDTFYTELTLGGEF
jgi:hypothetical protein